MLLGRTENSGHGAEFVGASKQGPRPLIPNYAFRIRRREREHISTLHPGFGEALALGASTGLRITRFRFVPPAGSALGGDNRIELTLAIEAAR